MPPPPRKHFLSKFSLFFEHKSGFTLAEVLITLGIIGIVAALTIPNLIAEYQKKATISKLKKSYSLIFQALNRAEIDNGPVSTWSIRAGEGGGTGLNFSKKYLVPYLNIAGYKKYPTGLWPKNVAGVQMNYCSAASNKVPCTVDGMCFWNCGVYNIIDYNYIVVDINGIKKPNRAGRDIFIFSVDFSTDKKKGSILSGKTWKITSKTSREELLNQCNKTSTGWSNSTTCFELIFRDGWQIKDDYPW